MSDISKNSVTIEAPLSEVSAVLSDLADYPSWSTAIKSVEVQEKDSAGRATKAKISIDAGVMKDRVILDYDWSSAPLEITFSLDDLIFSSFAFTSSCNLEIIFKLNDWMKLSILGKL